MKKFTNSAAWWRQMGIATTIPVVLAAGPIVGYFLGHGVDQRLGSDPWGGAVGVGLGMVSGAMQAKRLLDQLANHHDPTT